MGQQQLLLLVLATVIVGLATVAGIQAFEQGQTRANQDALTSTAVKIASDLQARIKEPSQFGGYDGDVTAATGNVTLDELGYETTGDDEYEAADGTCGVFGGGADPKSIKKDNVSPSDLSLGTVNLEVLCESDDNEVLAGIEDTDPEDIESTTAVLP